MAGAGINKLGEWRAEVAALTQLRHPHIVHYLGAVQEPPTHCLVLEYCAGGDLRSALRAAVPAGFVLRVFCEHGMQQPAGGDLVELELVD